VLWSLNATRVLPVASLVKTMTALLVVRAAPADALVPITRDAVNAAGSKVGVLPKGRSVRLETLLYGLLLPSGNDAAVALAEHVAGSVPAFTRRMNEQAQSMGLRCTHFASPDGLEDANRSCAVDLETLARADLAQPRIARVAGSESAVEPLPIKGGRVWLYNNNPLLRYGYPGADGLKTGETEAAGLCLVGTARRDGVRLGVVLLHSPELGRQAEALLNAGFADVYHQRPRLAPPVPRGR
jgi:D-alanyl-D-alanine carboxypeptidase